MQITGKLDVDFLNLGYDRSINENLSGEEYLRVDRCWNIYYHGFMDEFDDIAYVKGNVSIEPGIYEVVTYGIPAILFLWRFTHDHHRDLKGLIVKVGDDDMMKDAYQKWFNHEYFI
ncbi:hypothetical protein ST201phi2-1p307 [Pseudomonas phage 201phi2-1]|uniref:Uncharacterized protein n=1 Tax=Pseudomonas phage 201phi2-1 TaxID=198110 RepID=B3FJG7_BP201|nr:hypothetical protein ST201phi2-1p307 [Pseudomonas phage 201phi2-1]ABY63133.1 hypothetical protein 201phi2-1p307 [Pseudomonas phage 201phi2-1]